MKANIHLWSCLAQLSLEWEMFQTKVVEKIKTHILRSITCFWKSYRWRDSVEKYCRAWQATDDNMAHADCMWITNATKTHSEYIIVIVFALQEWLHERASLLRYTYIVCLFIESLLSKVVPSRPYSWRFCFVFCSWWIQLLAWSFLYLSEVFCSAS
jgi:hypothetical protein